MTSAAIALDPYRFDLSRHKENGFQSGDPNLYGYVLNDPVNWTDPSGKGNPLQCGLSIGGIWALRIAINAQKIYNNAGDRCEAEDEQNLSDLQRELQEQINLVKYHCNLFTPPVPQPGPPNS
jgi:uncharacterized protein RhaS with RHS repeats